MAKKPLSLSTLSLYTDSEPEKAEEVANIFQQILARPDIQEALQTYGISPESLLDGPLTARGIATQRALRDRQSEGFIGSIERGQAKVLAGFGLDRPVRAGIDFIMGEGGEGPRLEPTPESSKIDTFLGRGDPVEVGSQVVGNLAPMVLGFGAAAGLQSAGAGILPSALTTGALGSAARFGATFGGLEAARQIGRNLANGEPFNPTSIAAEAIVGAASGTPVSAALRGGQVTRRLLSGAIPAVAAGLVGGALGKEESGMDGTRIASEALFGMLLPPSPLKPRGPMVNEIVSIPPTPVALDQKAVLQAALDRIKQQPVEAVQAEVRARIGRMSPSELERLAKSGANPESEIFRQIMESDNQLETGIFTPATRPLVEQYLEARIQIVDEMALLSEDALRQGMKLGGPEGQAAADALAMKFKATREAAAPAENLIAKEPKVPMDIDAAANQAAFKTETQNAAIAAIREIIVPPKLAAIRANNIAARTAFEEILKITQADASERATNAMFELRKGTRDVVGLPHLLKGFPSRPKPLKVRPDFETGLREHLLPQRSAELKDLESKLTAKLREEDLLRAIPEGAPKNSLKFKLENEIRTLIAQQQDLVSAINETLDTAVPVIIQSSAEARDIVRELMSGMNPNDIGYFMKNLPTPLRAYESILRPTMSQMARSTFRAQNDASRKLTNMVRQLRGDRTFKDPGHQILPQQTLPEMQVSAREQGYELNFLSKKEGYKLTANGVSLRFKNITQARQYVNENLRKQLGSDPLNLDKLAGERLMSVGHIGDGRFHITNHMDGSVREAANPTEAKAMLIETPALSQQAPDVSANSTPEFTRAVTGNRAQSSNSRPALGMRSPQLDGKPRVTVEADKIENVKFDTGWIKNMKELLIQVEQAFPDVRAYSDVFDGMFVASNQKAQYLIKPMKQLRKVLENVDSERMSAIQDTLLARGNTRDILAGHYRLSGDELRAVEGLKEWYGEVLELNSQGVDELLEGMGKFRASKGDPHRLPGLDGYMLPRTMEHMRKAIVEGRWRPGGIAADEVATTLMHEMGNTRFGVDRIMSEGYRQAGELRKKALTLAPGTPDRTKIDLMESAMNRYLSILGDRADLSTRYFSEGWNQAMVPWLKKLSKITTMGKSDAKYVKGDYLTPADIDQWSSYFTTWYSGAAMAGRVALVVRNSAQSLLPASKIGVGRTLYGIKQALNPTIDTWAQARKAGVMDDAGGVLDMDVILKKGGPHEGFFRKAMRIGLGPYKKIDSFNRVASYFGGRKAIEDLAPDLLAGKTEKFLLETGLATDSKLIQDTVVNLVKNKSVDAAADFYGRHIMQETQFIYQRWNLPEMLGGANPAEPGKVVTGKLFGQFGVWPVSYWNYMRSNLVTNGGESLLNRGRLQFAKNSAIVLGGTYAFGQATGIDTNSWNFASPLEMEGGPAWQALRDTVRYIRGNQYDFQLAKSSLKRFLWQTGTPFGSLIHDINQAQDAEGLEKLLLGLGFNLTEEPKGGE